MTSGPPWRVHLSTADRTCVRLALRPRPAAAPWATAGALWELARLGALREGAPRSLGAGRGVPLLLAHSLRWRGMALHLEAVDGEIAEVTLELPAWDALCAGATGDDEPGGDRPDEDGVWDLVDTLAAATDALHGTIGDGEAMLLAPPRDDGDRAVRLRRHHALLVPEGEAGVAAASGALYRVLPASRLAVLLR